MNHGSKRTAKAQTAYEQVKHYIDHHFEDAEVLLYLRSKLQWVWIDELMRKRDVQQAFLVAVRMVEQLGENGSLLHMTHYLDRVIAICQQGGREELAKYRRMRDALAGLYNEYDKVWESGDLRLWKRIRVNGVEGIANMLRCEREAADLTQEQLAELLELDSKTVSRIECGRSQPKAGTLQRILERFRYGSTACYTKLVVGSFALLYDDAGNKEDCISLLEQMRTGYEHSPADLRHQYTIVNMIYTNLAMSYEETDQFEKSIMLFDQAIRFTLRCSRGNRLGFLHEGKAFTIERMTETDQKSSYQDAYQLMKLMQNSKSSLESMREYFFEKYGENLEPSYPSA